MTLTPTALDHAALAVPRRLWWPWDDPADVVAFRRAFTLHARTTVTLHLTSSGPVRVHIDGAELTLHGQALPTWRTMRRATLVLDAGDHRVDVHAEQGEHAQPFILGSLDWTHDERAARVATDASWLMRRDAPPDAWTAPDASFQRAAWAFDGPWAEPWGFPCDAPDDYTRLTHGWQRLEQGILDRVASAYPGAHALGASIERLDPHALTLRPARPHVRRPPTLDPARRDAMWQYARETHAKATNDWLGVYEARAPHVVLDVGRETFARVRVQVRSGGRVILAVTTGESSGEVQRHTRRLTDVVELHDGESFTTSPTGLRYVKLLALACDEDALTLEPIVVQHVRYDARFTGAFQCSDERLNRIWQVSARTARLCMQNELWDGVKRDQRPWVGDLHVEARVSYALTADPRLVRRTLAVLAEIGPAPARSVEQQRSPGLRASEAALWGRDHGDMNNIASYTLWWVIALGEYQRFTNDPTLLRELRGELHATMRHVARHVDDTGRWSVHVAPGQDDWAPLFIDWAPLTSEERTLCCHLLAIQALRAGASMLDEDGAPYDDLAARLTSAARAHLGRRAGWPRHVASLAVLTDVLPASEAARLFSTSVKHRDDAQVTFWYRYNDLRAAARLGDVQWGLDAVRRHWGAMLDLNVTAFWEAFDPAWATTPDPHAVAMIADEHAGYGGYGTSLCHGWSGGPAAWLPAAVLGVTPSSAGFHDVTFRPDLADLDWARGAIPTPHGEIHVCLSSRPRTATIEVPTGIHVHVPDEVGATWTVKVTPYDARFTPA